MVTRQVKGCDIIAGTVQINQFRVMCKIQSNYVVVTADQLLKLRVMSYIDIYRIVIGTVVILKTGIPAYIDTSQPHYPRYRGALASDIPIHQGQSDDF